MKKNILYLVAAVVLIQIGLSAPLLAGQVVTEKDRAWARQVLAQEKSLKTAAGENTVAVFYFSNSTKEKTLDPFQKGIAIMLMSDLSKVQTLTLVERTRIQALLDEMNLGKSGLMDRKTAPKAGKLIGANFIVGGDFQDGKATALKIESDVVKVKLPEISDTVLSEGQFQELLALEKKLAFKIIESLNIQLTPKEETELKKPMSRNMRALEYLFTGIDMSDRGKYQMAKRYYQKALELDPHLSIATRAITELSDLALVKAQPQTGKILASTRKLASTTGNMGFDLRYNRSHSGVSEALEVTDVRVKW